jgi:hypothetical protein
MIKKIIKYKAGMIIFIINPSSHGQEFPTRTDSVRRTNDLKK